MVARLNGGNMLLQVLALAAAASWGVKAASLPDKVYGVNLGSWYVRFYDGLAVDGLGR